MAAENEECEEEFSEQLQSAQTGKTSKLDQKNRHDEEKVLRVVASVVFVTDFGRVSVFFLMFISEVQRFYERFGEH